jgi:MoxR-like ATPase
MVALARVSRQDERSAIGVSPRGIQRLFEAARARAVIAGRDYVTPADVKATAMPTMSHRIIRTTDASVEGVDQTAIVQHALDEVNVPAVSPDPPADAFASDGRAEDSTDGDPEARDGEGK